MSRNKRSRRALAVVIAVASVNCDGGTDAPGLAAVDRDWVDLAVGGACDHCIQLRRTALLGERDGPGYLEELSPRVLTDGEGRHWVYQRGTSRVFGADGRHIRDVGRSGQGPMEFADPWPIHRDEAGNVHIVDPGNSRLTIVAPDFSLVEERALPGVAGFNDATRVGDEYALNHWLPTAGGIGQPIHIADDAGVLRSFGAGDGDEVVDRPAAMRILATGTSDRVLSARRFDYSIEIWTPEGTRAGGFKGPTLNEKAVLPTFYGPDNPLPAEIVHMRADGGRLWVLIRTPRSDWLRHMVEHRYRSGLVGYRLREGASFDSLYASRIDLIDLDRGVLAASQRVDGVFSLFTEQGLLVRNELLPDGTPALTLWRADVIR